MKPTKPGWYWYRSDNTGIIAVEVFESDEALYGADNLVVAIPSYRHSPQVSKLEGEWSDFALPDPPWEEDERRYWADGRNLRKKGN